MTSGSLPLSIAGCECISQSLAELSKLKDAQLMERLKEGDQEAFGQVLDRYYIAARSIAPKMLRDPEDVADVVQESFLDVYQNAGSFAPVKGTLKGWISCLTYHRVLKRLHLLKRRDCESGGLGKAGNSVRGDVKPEQWIRSLEFCTG